MTSEIKLPPPCDTALVQGPQGSEYKLLSDSYEPDCAMYSPNQLIAAVLADRSAQQESKPMTNDEIFHAWKNSKVPSQISFMVGVKVAEAFHGIKGTP